MLQALLVERFKLAFHRETREVDGYALVQGRALASLEDAQQKIDACRWDYNENHPHRALKGLSPREYAQRVMTTAAHSPS